MSEISIVLEKIASALESNSKKFEELDAVAGDGDLGIAVGKIASGNRLKLFTSNKLIAFCLGRIYHACSFDELSRFR